MKSQSFTALVLFGSMAAAAVKKIGCYSTTASLKLSGTDTYNSIGYCSKKCSAHKVFAMVYYDCYCGDEIPADSDKIKDSECDSTCPGYTADICGSKFTNSTSIYLADGVASVPKASGSAKTTSSTSSASSTATSKPSLTTSPEGQTVTVTPSSAPSSEPTSSKPNVAGIAAGVVVGVLAIMGIAGGAFLIIRRRKRRAIEEEHQRNAAVKNFTSPPMSAGSSSFTDTRLDPVLAQRRMSDGSIADNQDYSRRILKVTNA